MATYTIGRSDENDIVLSDSTVSRQHAELETRKRGVYVLRDLDSTYGTRIYRDGEWLDIIEVEVADDTEVTFGEHRTTIAEILALAAPPAGAEAVAASPAEPAPAETPAPADAPAEPAPSAPVAAPASAPAGPAADGAGMDRRMKLMIMIGGGVLLLIIAIVVIVVLVSVGSSMVADRHALQPPPSPATATRATFEASLAKNCNRHGRLSESQCRCIAQQISAALTREELAIYLALQGIKVNGATMREIVDRFGAEKIEAIRTKHRNVLSQVREKCGLTLKR